MCRTVSVVVLSLVLFSLPLAAQTPSQVAGPVLPDTITRGPDGNVTVRAVRLDEPLALDGELDEAVCQGRSKIRPPWRRKTRPLGSWVEWRNAAVRRGRQDAGVAAGWRAFLLCSRR